MGSVTEADVVQGLSNKEFVLHYQPKVSLVTNRVVGAEGLARWRRQDGSVATPAAFMPAVLAAGLSKTLSLQLLDRLIQDMHDTLGADIRISFNVGVEDFEDDAL